jgi:glutathione synthase/RimK-type ligase-like ATP-grasp enzyme/gamma-glutamyl:cysteine ligase YbdK (ATP-grasp superfamily)
VLFDEADVWSPSSPETIDKLERVAARMNVHVHRIGLGDLAKLGEYDALFVRALTGVSEPAFPFVLRAEALKMPAVDDSQSIIRCSNKVFLEELLAREGIPTPRTRVVTSRTPWEQLEALGLPFVIKLPDGSFSAAVHKVASRDEYRSLAGEMFRRSPLIIAQEFLPTEWDWRVAVLDGRPLFVARYYMASGHWQIRAEEHGAERFGRVRAVPRGEAPRPVVELALRAAGLIGSGLYGVDIKETAAGPVVIEINDNPNLDVGYDDAADGNRIYEDLVAFFLRRIEQGGDTPPAERPPSEIPGALSRIRAPIRRAAPARPPHYRPFSVAGVELEYAVVDRDLNVASRVESAFRVLAGRAVSDVELGSVAFSNEIADHVFEVKTVAPVASLRTAEEVLAEGVQRFSAVLRQEWDARLLPTGMHPWMDPRRGHLWTRSNACIYATYDRLFDVRTHGWMNVHASHLSLPMGREEEATAMLNASALLVPYLPALAASSPMHDGELQPHADSRLAWILEHQARIPESQGEIVPEYVEGLSDYRKRILGPMYAALDRLPDAGELRHDFFNARGAVFKLGSKRMEVRVLDAQECVRMDIVVAVFVRAALKHLTRRLAAGRLPLPEHKALVDDFRACIRDGSRARVRAPHLGDTAERDAEGRVGAGEVLRVLLEGARKSVPKKDAEYLDLAERMIAAGTLSERIRAALEPFTSDDEGFTEEARKVYIELMDCLETNEPWGRRGL